MGAAMATSRAAGLAHRDHTAVRKADPAVGVETVARGQAEALPALPSSARDCRHRLAIKSSIVHGAAIGAGPLVNGPAKVHPGAVARPVLGLVRGRGRDPRPAVGGAGSGAQAMTKMGNTGQGAQTSPAPRREVGPGVARGLRPPAPANRLNRRRGMALHYLRIRIPVTGISSTHSHSHHRHRSNQWGSPCRKCHPNPALEEAFRSPHPRFQTIRALGRLCLHQCRRWLVRRRTSFLVEMRYRLLMLVGMWCRLLMVGDGLHSLPLRRHLARNTSTRTGFTSKGGGRVATAVEVEGMDGAEGGSVNIGAVGDGLFVGDDRSGGSCSGAETLYNYKSMPSHRRFSSSIFRVLLRTTE
jgi:hypothetical protein